MKVILLERIAKLGKLGNIVNVKDGFARNYLLPQKKALRANQANLAVFEAQKKQLEESNEKAKQDSMQTFEKMDGLELIVIRQASETGVLYGSVSTKDIANALIEKKFSVLKSQVVLNHPIKETGVYTVEIKLHPEVLANVKVNVARTMDEAKAVHTKPKKKKEEKIEKVEVKSEEKVEEVKEEVAKNES